MLKPRVVHEDIHLFLPDLFYKAGIGNVTGIRSSMQVLCSLIRPLRIHVIDQDLRSCSTQNSRDPEADTGTGAGYQGGLPGQIHMNVASPA